jgi:hypothetical protein
VKELNCNTKERRLQRLRRRGRKKKEKNGGERFTGIVISFIFQIIKNAISFILYWKNRDTRHGMSRKY